MKKSLLAIVAIGLLTTQGVAGQTQRAPIQGVWRVVEVTLTGPGARTISPGQSNLTIITGRYYSRVEDQSERPRPVLAEVAKASADELRAAWGSFVGETGTYELTQGNVITMRPVAAKNPAAMAAGSFVTYSYKLDGDTLWVTQLRNQNGAFVNPVTIKAVRVE